MGKTGGREVAQRWHVRASNQKVGGSTQVRSSTIHLLSATNWPTKGRVMCHHVYVIVLVKDP